MSKWSPGTEYTIILLLFDNLSVNYFLLFQFRIESYSCKMVGDEKHKYKKFYSQSGTQPGDLEALGCSPNSDPRYGRR